MIHRVKTVTWEVRSHGFTTIFSDTGRVIHTSALFAASSQWIHSYIKKMVWHLQDVLKCMRQIEKEKQARKERKKDRDFAEKVIDKLVKEDKARQI